jgi:glucose/arabinose dehydrogenase
VPSRRLALLGAAVAVGAIAVGIVVVTADEDEDPVNVDCGPEELATPTLVEAGADAPAVPAVVLEPLVEEESVTSMAARPDGRLLVLTRRGDLLQVDPGGGAPEVLLDQDLPQENEAGGLGVAVDPAGAYVYLTLTPDDTQSVLVEYPLTAEGIDVAARREVTAEPNRDLRHLMANLAFGPDGYLYVGVGDGAQPEEQAGQVNPTAQDLSQRKGKIWRIDPRPSGSEPYSVPADNPFVGEPDAVPETYLVGVRNPWRFSFDAETGDLWVGDAGEYCAEEISRVAAGEQAGANLGWNTYEGPLRFDPDTETPDVVAPVHWYQRDLGDEEAGEPARCAVIGGVVYRGDAIEGLAGRYVFGDYCSGRIEVLDLDGDERVVRTLVELPALLQGIGVDADGELYALTDGGAFSLVAG